MATTPIPNTTFPATRSAINANLAQINTDMSAKADAAATTAALAAKADATATTAALATKAATSHTHAIADTTGLQAAIDAKADAASTTSALAGKAATSHAHNASDINAGTLAPDRLATGTGLQVVRRNAGNTALEFATVSVGAGDMLAANNLSDVANTATARTNLGLGTAATQASTAFADAAATTAALATKAAASHSHSDATTSVPGYMSAADKTKLDGVQTGATDDQTAAEIKAALETLTGANRLDASALKNLPGGGDMLAANNLSELANAATARTNLGLGSVNNTADSAKPVSAAQQAALDLKAPLASPTFTGTPAVPTAAPGTNTTQAASTAFVAAAVAGVSGGGGGSHGFIFGEPGGPLLTVGLSKENPSFPAGTFNGFNLLVDAGTITIQFQKASTSGGVVGSYATVFSATVSSGRFNSGDTTGWASTSRAAGDVFKATITLVSGVREATLTFF